MLNKFISIVREASLICICLNANIVLHVKLLHTNFTNPFLEQMQLFQATQTHYIFNQLRVELMKLPLLDLPISLEQKLVCSFSFLFITTKLFLAEATFMLIK